MVYSILDFGAVADGTTNNGAAIQAALDACARTGGTVEIPAGNFLSGSLRIYSHTRLYLAQGATLTASHRPEDMIDFAAEDSGDAATGMDGAKDGCFLYACHAEGITICGQGKIDGGGRNVYYDADNDNGFHEAPLAVRGFRPRTSYLEDVDGLTVQGITFYDSCFWTLHMAGCRNVMVEGIRILNDDRGPNNDGIDPDGCQNVVIRNCIVSTGDDAIVLKATRPIAAKYGNCENVTISGCVLHSRDSALKIGTETWGDIRNVVFSDCVIDRCSRAVGIWVRDGGCVERINIHHLTGSTRRYAEHFREGKPTGWWGKGEAIFLSAVPRSETHPVPGTIRRISIDHLQLDAELGYFLAARGGGVIEHVSLTDCDLFLRRQSEHTPEYYDEQPSARGVYRHALSWLYARGVKGLKVQSSVTMDEFMERYISGEADVKDCKAFEFEKNTD
ncbi:MAG: right-handed parallel beta-helix repeat-containing protein [Clostridia bacterium]|nr:right-handed parallel beta-helix repeat-containing protein [Clostridia bacterium]